jgi:hypothetical protein
VDHTNHSEQAAKGLMRAKGHVCQNCPEDICRECNWNIHHLCMKHEEDQSSYVDYIFAIMGDNLDDQISHAKVCSSHRYEQQNLMKNMIVITEIFPANGYRNPASPNTYQVIHGPKMHFQKAQNYTTSYKISMC